MTERIDFDEWEPDIPLIRRLSGQGMTEKQIADRLGMHVEVFQEFRADYSNGIHYAIIEGLAESVDNVSAALLKKALDGQYNSMALFLTRKAGWIEDDNDDQSAKKLPSSFSFSVAKKNTK
jgi:hypothetical protein